jgi:hypothetical protein
MMDGKMKMKAMGVVDPTNTRPDPMFPTKQANNKLDAIQTNEKIAFCHQFHGREKNDDTVIRPTFSAIGYPSSI